MLFTEPRFLFFFAVAFGVHWALRGDRGRKRWLLLCSYVFYGAWDPRFLLLIFGSTVIDYVASHRLESARDRGAPTRPWLILSLVANLGILGFFKYFNFFATSGAALLTWLGLPVGDLTLSIVLPVGISFFTFQTMSYSIDVYRGQLRAERDFWDFALFVGFFPQLVAGPIVRAIDFLPQLAESKRWQRIPFQSALWLFLIGFIKKACIADGIAPTVDAVYGDPAAFDAASMWIATAFYAIQIYCDFSGYSDMAIACARLFGYELRLNFAHPYFARDITDFWRRWHISLSGWLRDYLYIPLGGNRGSRLFTHRNLMLTMLLGGLWHGAGWNFVVWGALHGGALVLHKEWMRWREHRPARVPILSWLAMLAVVLTAWVFFRATSFGDAFTIVRGCWTFQAPGTESVDPRLALLLVPLTAMHALAAWPRVLEGVQRVPAPVATVALGALSAIALLFVPIADRPFIYFQF